MKYECLISALSVLSAVKRIFTVLLLCLSVVYGAEKPNVVMIAVDDMNDWTGVLGGHRLVKTPNLDRLMQQSVSFSNAHCNAPVCSASRNSLLTGLLPHTTGWYTNGDTAKKPEQVLGDHPTMIEHFKNNGYRTIGAGKIYHHWHSDYRKEQWDCYMPLIQLPDYIAARGSGYSLPNGTHYHPFPKDGGAFQKKFGMGKPKGFSLCGGPLDIDDMPNGKMPDEMIADWSIEQLKAFGKKKSEVYKNNGEIPSQNNGELAPLFMAVGFVRPHVPYTAPRKYFDMYNPADIELARSVANEMDDIPAYGKAMTYGFLPGGDHQSVKEMGADYQRELIHAYLACVSFVDVQIGRLLTALEQSPHLQNTIVVLWSDHGQNLGEKNNWRKMCLWEESTRVPFAIRVPANSSNGQSSKRAVSLVDLYPTLNELCGLPALKRLDGQSLVPLLNNPDKTWDNAVLTTWMYQNYSLRDEHWRYIRYRDGQEELYDHCTDPGEHTNLAGLAKSRPVLNQLRQKLPQTESLPITMKTWQGDALDKIVQDHR